LSKVIVFNVVAVVLSTVAGSVCGDREWVFAQSQQLPQVQMPDASEARPGEPEDPLRRQMLEKLEGSRNAARQAQLVKDTDKLLALATELKTEVAKTNKNVLSIEVVKKAEEIEKLAKSVKEKMKE
jgi:hypothetical protein